MMLLDSQEENCGSQPTSQDLDSRGGCVSCQRRMGEKRVSLSRALSQEKDRGLKSEGAKNQPEKSHGLRKR